MGGEARDDANGAADAALGRSGTHPALGPSSPNPNLEKILQHEYEARIRAWPVSASHLEVSYTYRLRSYKQMMEGAEEQTPHCGPRSWGDNAYEPRLRQARTGMAYDIRKVGGREGAVAVKDRGVAEPLC